MDIHNIRQLLRTKTIYDLPLRVTFYARVSSESDEQLNSLGNQIGYYEDFIKKNPAWTFVPGYIDEGISGASTRHREDFNRMVEDAAAGKFDFVITKEISRFARNTLDSIQFTRQLLKLEDVIKVEQLEPEKCIQTELLLVKIATGGQPAQALKLVQAHGGRVLDIGKTTITVEFTGQSDMVDRVVEQMETLGIVEMARTGMTALERGDTTIHADMNL